MSKIRVVVPSKQKLEDLKVKEWTPWECEPSVFDWEYDCDETAYVLEGRVKVKTEEGEVEIKKGDLAYFPKGLKCRWNVVEKIKKVYKF